MNRSRPMRRPPSPPGEILNEEFLDPLGLTQAEFAKRIDCDAKTINRIVKGRTRVTAEMAVRLGSALGTAAELWMNLQSAVDLYVARRNLGHALPSRIPSPARKTG